MVLAAQPLPQISISPAPEDTLIDSFLPCSWAKSDIQDDDSFRPKHLTPPPTHLRFVGRQPSPLRPVDPADVGKGLERDRFEALLNAARERNANVRKPSDLRKEIALKVHKSKQVERRALFLSKVLAPPSPTATSLPKTPPESPAVFHYTLPSPGLVSPLALFESLYDNAHNGNAKPPCEPWVEQVDFRLPVSAKQQQSVSNSNNNGSFKPAKGIPSLDEISARMSSQTLRSSSISRLPAFLTQPRAASARPERPRVPLNVGRLQMPKPSKPSSTLTTVPPQSPCSPLSPQLQITTTVVPRSSSKSPTELTETNLLALDSREQRARDMLSTIRRRVLPSDLGLNGRDDGFSDVPDDRKYRRKSAPAEMVRVSRTGFEHQVLSLAGGF